ncbi:histidinol-phosphate transaminase [Bacillus sp. AGMB 02131]|uniref:Histidinol-phosphate aminotransferase n=1 Tax=Peribacillus faecalis TaxID=2772559 RepID=A0A927D1A3_9BACI|nr:histidinol-phosphate transaminase [Peribacillus faecalis]MBD3110397.1 histidinol-phosphate transaminase [Peribacillus faecalis]
MKWKTNILDLKAYQPGRSTEAVKKEFGLDNITKLASNENPYGYSLKVLETLQEKPSQFAIYPDGNGSVLKEALSRFYNLPEDRFLLGNGSDEIIGIISRSILRPGINTVMATPSFSQYKHNAIVENAEVREIPLTKEGDHDLNAMLEAIDENTGVVWLCTPNNPSGVYIAEGDLIPFLEAVPKDVVVVLDEAYREYVVAEDYPDSLQLVEKYPNVIVLHTFSKIYGLASFRVGYAIANEEVIAKLNPVREPFNVNTFGQWVSVAALEDQDFVESCREKNREGLQQYYSFCEEEKLSYYPSQANFILIDFGISGDDVFHYLMSKGYIVRSGVALGFPTCVRITVGTKEQNDGIISELRGLLAEKRNK